MQLTRHAVLPRDVLVHTGAAAGGTGLVRKHARGGRGHIAAELAGDSCWGHSNSPIDREVAKGRRQGTSRSAMHMDGLEAPVG